MKCSNCGAPLEKEGNGFVCKYCGRKFLKEEVFVNIAKETGSANVQITVGNDLEEPKTAPKKEKEKKVKVKKVKEPKIKEPINPKKKRLIMILAIALSVVLVTTAVLLIVLLPKSDSAPSAYKLSEDGTYYIYANADKSATTIVIPETYNGKPVQSIGDYAFYDCDSLTSVTIGSGVQSIGFDAFRDCDSLTSIVIPNSVTSIGSGAFYDCLNLIIYCEAESKPSGWYGDWNSDNRPVVWDCNNSEIIDGKVYTIVDGVRYEINNSVATVVGRSSNITTVNIPSSITCGGNSYNVTSIGYNAFYDCDSLTSVVIPNSVTSIGEQAFLDCTSLTSVTIPNSVTSIGDGAFKNCSNLTIYCEAESQPSGWNSEWNKDNRPVVWGYNG